MAVTPKVYKTHKQQLKILRNRGMVINKGEQGSKVIKILERENYYSVVNGYKDPFINQRVTPETYLNNTKFDELYALFLFDRDVRLLYLRYILKIEHQIKTVIAHEFSRIYGHDNYLKTTNFDVSTPDKLKEVTKLFGTIQHDIAGKLAKNRELTHYMSTYGYVPLWVLVNILTLGTTSHFYSAMKQTDQNTVAHFFGIQPAELEKFLTNLTLARNLCAHDERFYDFHYRAGITVTYITNFNLLGFPINNGNYAYGTHDAFSIAVIFTLLLPNKDIKEFVASMDKLFSKLGTVLSPIAVANIQSKMGFVLSWKNLPKIK